MPAYPLFTFDGVKGIPTSLGGSTKTPLPRAPWVCLSKPGAETLNTEVERVHEEHVRSVALNTRADNNLKRKRQLGALGHCSPLNSQATRIQTSPQSARAGPVPRLGKSPGNGRPSPFALPLRLGPRTRKGATANSSPVCPAAHSVLSVPDVTPLTQLPRTDISFWVFHEDLKHKQSLYLPTFQIKLSPNHL